PLTSTLSLHDALPIYARLEILGVEGAVLADAEGGNHHPEIEIGVFCRELLRHAHLARDARVEEAPLGVEVLARHFVRSGAHDDVDRKSTRLNSSHVAI